MTPIELRDRTDARKFILQGLWLQQSVSPPAPHLAKDVLTWGLEIANNGHSLPPIGFVADIGIEVFQLGRGQNRVKKGSDELPSLPSILRRTYEDYVLGRIYRDLHFERAGDALRRFDKKQSWARGLAFLIGQIRRLTRFPGILLSPAILRALRDQPEHEILEEGRKSWETNGLMPVLQSCYQSMVEAFRNTADVLLESDVRALENGVALQPESQQMAHEQVMLTSRHLRDELPKHMPNSLAGRHDVPTRVLDEDTYPVGGYASISTHGSIESLLQSQLAYMEPVTRPDLFDIKYLRDELYYYARDENQFLRRRRSFVFAFYPDLAAARTKDPNARFQRIVMLLGLIHGAVSKLTEWLSDDSLKFVFVFLGDGSSFALSHECGLMNMLFREQIENHSVVLMPGRRDGTHAGPLRELELSRICQNLAQRSLCHCLLLTMQERTLEAGEVVMSRLVLDAACPSVGDASDQTSQPMDDWTQALEWLLQIWV